MYAFFKIAMISTSAMVKTPRGWLSADSRLSSILHIYLFILIIDSDNYNFLNIFLFFSSSIIYYSMFLIIFCMEFSTVSMRDGKEYINLYLVKAKR